MRPIFPRKKRSVFLLFFIAAVPQLEFLTRIIIFHPDISPDVNTSRNQSLNQSAI